MDKGSASLFGATAVITAAIIGGIYLLDRAQRSAQPGSISSPSSQNGQSPLLGSTSDSLGSSSGTNTPNVSAETSRTNQILTCDHPKYGTVYTNAASCEEADLDNRISIAEPLHQTPGQDRYSGNAYQTPENEAGNSRTNRQPKNKKPSLQLHGKSPPSGLNVNCKFSVGKALEIERDLAATDDPRKSTWRESYCKQRCEAIKEACPVADDYFYYRFGNICPGSDHYPCYVENS